MMNHLLSQRFGQRNPAEASLVLNAERLEPEHADPPPYSRLRQVRYTYDLNQRH